MQWHELIGSLIGIGLILNPLTVGAIAPRQMETGQTETGQIETEQTETGQRIRRDRPNPTQPIRPESICPDDVETLSALLLRDLPSYANRVSQRAFTRIRTTDRPGYVLIAGRPEFEPLTLGPGLYQPALPDPEAGLEQIFFTTLNRQYTPRNAAQIQHFHWVFLVQTPSGWRLATMFSQLGRYPANQPTTPPRDSSQGVIAQAIRIWLRDCNTGNVVPLGARGEG